MNQTSPNVFRRVPIPDTAVVPMSHLTRHERLALDNAVSPFGNPEQVFNRKVSVLANLLHCTEDEATHILLHNL